ncbi:hypothetical protein MUK42_03120 [Musa troglodytarum]|uniref:Uncharacterized protein n=1 Tax=Musa troglodytarum TaxID=320322 RepID=A0A9E7KB88_9LILI|nr:hypothetical protein MUK42_03120 [Musa troglodytarum]URE11121.1 hypothetical protein MUK42_03120 [Musa troglodytarum]
MRYTAYNLVRVRRTVKENPGVSRRGSFTNNWRAFGVRESEKERVNERCKFANNYSQVARRQVSVNVQRPTLSQAPSNHVPPGLQVLRCPRHENGVVFGCLGRCVAIRFFAVSTAVRDKSEANAEDSVKACCVAALFLSLRGLRATGDGRRARGRQRWDTTATIVADKAAVVAVDVGSEEGRKRQRLAAVVAVDAASKEGRKWRRLRLRPKGAAKGKSAGGWMATTLRGVVRSMAKDTEQVKGVGKNFVLPQNRGGGGAWVGKYRRPFSRYSSRLQCSDGGVARAVAAVDVEVGKQWRLLARRAMTAMGCMAAG